MGAAERFVTAEKCAGYCGLVSRVHSSGGLTRQGCNASLKWAFVGAAEAIVSHQKTMSHRHVVGLYQRVKRDKKDRHGKAMVAVARHLADAVARFLRTRPWQRGQGLHPSRGTRAPESSPCGAVVVVTTPSEKKLLPDVRADR